MPEILDDFGPDEDSNKPRDSNEKYKKLKWKLFRKQFIARLRITILIVLVFGLLGLLMRAFFEEMTFEMLSEMFGMFLFPIVLHTNALVSWAHSSIIEEKTGKEDLVIIVTILIVPIWALLGMMSPDLFKMEPAYFLSEIFSLSYQVTSILVFFIVLEIFINLLFWFALNKKRLKHYEGRQKR